MVHGHAHLNSEDISSIAENILRTHYFQVLTYPENTIDKTLFELGLEVRLTLLPHSKQVMGLHALPMSV